MSDWALCPGYDHQPQCATCWRTPANHTLRINEFWQAWITPPPSDPCPLHIPVEDK